MKRIAIYSLAMLSFLVTSCYEKKEKPIVEEPYQGIPKPEKPLMLDTLLIGRLGEETAMSSLQIITQEGDTVSVIKSKANGNVGTMLGDVRNYEDRVMVTALVDKEGNYYLNTFLNISQLEGSWKSNDISLSLLSDSTVSGYNINYSHWKIHKCKLLLVGDNTTEYGSTQHTDTAIISQLDADSLFISIPRHGELKFGKK